jgi:hypothetical protein
MREFKAPNVWCDATDPAGRPRRQWVTWASSRQAMVDWLKEREWTVHRVRDYDFAAEWQRDAQARTQQLLALAPAASIPAFDSAKWGALKRHLFDLFDGKCAYCDARVTHVDVGDVEHYRPKKRVDGEPSHPGYYWLAYDVSNFLPACALCNRGRGKANHFPVVEGTRARDPNGLPTEQPLLFHPYHDDGVEHFKILRTGQIVGRTDKGRTSVDVYGLKREGLPEERREAMEALKTRAMVMLHLSSLDDVCAELRADIEAGKAPFGVAQTWALAYVVEDFEEETEQIIAERQRAVRRARAGLQLAS